jgi:hypothetical protein
MAAWWPVFVVTAAAIATVKAAAQMAMYAQSPAR